jgi:hypothetical protein
VTGLRNPTYSYHPLNCTYLERGRRESRTGEARPAGTTTRQTNVQLSVASPSDQDHLFDCEYMSDKTMRVKRRRQSQRTMRRRCRSLVASLTILIVGHSQAQNVAQQCPTDASLTGFSTIASINDFMQDEILRIATGGAPQSGYSITLCPNTDFDASIESLKPVLSGVNFICGADGATTNNCNIRGGAEQVRIEDSLVPDYLLSNVSFSGLTFESFGTSVNGSASQTTTASFNNVTWKVGRIRKLLFLDDTVLVF